MRKLVVFEITERELRLYTIASQHSIAGRVQESRPIQIAGGEIIRISLSGIIEQGIVRDPEALLQNLLTCRAEHALESCLAFLAIPMQSGFVRSYRLPWLSKRDRGPAVALLVTEEVPGSSEVLYDYLILEEEKPEHLTILLAAARQEILNQYVTIFERAGICLAGVNFSPAVLGQSLGLQPSEDVLFLLEETEGLQMMLFHRGAPEGFRTLALPGLGTNFSTADQGRQSFWADWEKELQRFLVYFRTQYPELTINRLIWDGEAELKLFAENIAAANYISQVEGLPGGRRYRAITAYADLILAKTPVLNLWKSVRLKAAERQRSQRLVAVLGIVLLIGNGCWFFLQHLTSARETQVQMLERQGEKLEAEAKREQDLTRAWETVRAHSPKISRDLEQVQTLSQGVELAKLTYRQGNLSLSGRARDARSVEELLQGLRRMEWSRPQLTGYISTSVQNIEFSLSAKRDNLQS